MRHYIYLGGDNPVVLIKEYISLKAITEAWNGTKQFWDFTVHKPKRMKTMVYLCSAETVHYAAPYKAGNRRNTNTGT